MLASPATVVCFARNQGCHGQAGITSNQILQQVNFFMKCKPLWVAWDRDRT